MKESRPGPEGAVGRAAAAARSGRRALLTVVTPAYDEAENLPLLHERLTRVLAGQELDWEWVVIDDHSRDRTFEVVSELARRDPRVRALRLARNSGSHLALTCGLHQARGDCAVLMAADLQDPPEALPSLLEPWRGGAQVVWAVRRARPGTSASAVGFARLYYWLMRRVVGLSQMPATGADFLLVDRQVLDAFRQFGEGNTSVLALVTWMGFRQTSIGYEKQARVHGQSGWSLRKKLKLVVDSVTSFTALPLRAATFLGVGLTAGGLVAAAWLLTRALLGGPVAGWTVVLVALLVVGGLQLLVAGVLGEYLWRALEESRRRPRYLIEAATPEPGELGAGVSAREPAADD